MRYITKEIYELMQQTDFHILLRVNKRAETFDEEFYRKLYAKKLNEQLMSDLEESELKFEDIFDEFDFKDKAAYERARKEYEPPEFNESGSKHSFFAIHLMNIKRLKNSLPNEILEKVADIRVLAFDVASAEVKKLIAAFCKENERKVENAFRALQKAEEREFGNEEEDMPEFCSESLHDCEVLSCRKSGKDLVLDLDCSGGFANIARVIFKNAEIIEREGRLNGAVWLYDEICKCERGLEIHALLRGVTDLKYLTVRCEDAVFIYDEDDNEKEKAEI